MASMQMAAEAMQTATKAVPGKYARDVAAYVRSLV
jgi:hypothetical protein